MKFRAKLTIAMVLLLSLTYGIGGSLMIAQSFSSSICLLYTSDAADE